MRDLTVVLGGYNEAAEAAMAALDRAAGYRPFVAAMPESSDTSVPALSTYEPRVSVPIGALLWAISGKSTEAAGFTVQITDEGTKKPLFSQPIAFQNVSGQGNILSKNCYGQAVTFRSPLHVLPKPMVILGPAGLLRVKIENLAGVANVLQLALHFALPTRASLLFPNDYNRLMRGELALAMRAVRDEGANSVGTSGGATAATSGAGDSDVVSVAFDIATIGDNVIIAANPGGRIAINQFDLWNVSQQDIALKDGPSLLRGPLAQFPSQTGYGLSWSDTPHFRLTPGRPFILNLSAGTQVTGFIKYRIQ